MIVDVQRDGGCQTATFTIGTAAAGQMAPNRNWDIRVTQFGCGNQDESGPPGCLQWFTGANGNIMRYIHLPRVELVFLCEFVNMFHIFYLDKGTFHIICIIHINFSSFTYLTNLSLV